MKKNFYKIYGSVFSSSILYGYINTLIQIYIASTLGGFFNKATEGKTKDIINVGIKFISILLLITAVKYLVDLYINLKRQKNKEKFKKSIYEKLLNNSFEEVEKRTFGEILTRLDKDVNKIIDNLDDNLSFVIVGILSFITYFIYMFRINILFAVIVVILGAITLIPSYVLKNIYNKSFEEYNLIEERIYTFLNETLTGFEFIKLNMAYGYFEKNYHEISKDSGAISTKLDRLATVEKSLKTGIDNISKFGMYGVLALLLYRGNINFGQVVLCLLLGNQLLDTLKGIFDQYHNMQNCSISIGRIEELLKENGEEGTINISDIDNIEFHKVNFSYDEKDLVLKEINLKINKGDKVLLQGKNGAGKSTLIKLLLVLYSSYKGNIMVNGQELKHIEKKSYDEQICYASQNQFFLGNSPLENLLLFNSNESKAIDYLSELNLPIEHIREENCCNLSGGQKQKISLVRSMIREGSLIILDEPTNYLDKEGIEGLKNIIKESKKTILVISHDPSLTDIFQKIIKMEDGSLESMELGGVR